MSLHVVYDLATSPPTYDFVSFLLAAEMERQRIGAAEGLHVHILPGPVGGFRADKLPPFTVAEREAMLTRIVVPMAKMLPSVIGVTRHQIRPAALIGAFGHLQRRYSFPFLFAAARAGLYPLRASSGVAGEPYITITLREAAYWPTRNSNLVEWMQVAQWLRARGWRVVIVRDTAKAAERFGRFEVDTEAAVDLAHRAELYAGAALNLFTNNGPAWLCLFMGAPCMVFKMTADDAPCTNDAYLGQHGFRRGDVWPNLRPIQSVEWCDDRADKIIPAVAAMLAGASKEVAFA